MILIPKPDVVLVLLRQCKELTREPCELFRLGWVYVGRDVEVEEPEL